ncbi:MAG: FtsX-like permease family protein [Roseivirga sp.]|nr:FtsX-like permease family protein [Roseivirga sp.]
MTKKQRTPKFANFLLSLFCRKEYLDEIKGDLEETYFWRLQEKGSTRARLRYYLDVLSAIRLISLERTGESALSRGMLFNFAKSSLRNFQHHKTYTFLNVCGLALGMASALLILEYVSDELNYDQFAQSDDMYRISQDFVKNNERLYKTAVSPGPLAPVLLSDLPKVEKAARLLDVTRIWQGKNIFTLPNNPEKTFVEPQVYFADPDIVDLFDLSISGGGAKLNEPNTVLLSAEMAEKYFGSAENAIGQVIQFISARGEPQLLVTGVYQYPGSNMQVRPAALISYASTVNNFGEKGPHRMWGVNSCLTYVKLREGSDRNEFENQLADLLLKYNPLDTEEAKNGFRIGSLLVSPVKEIHLHSDYPDEVGAVENATTINVLIIIAIFIVTIAWVNYINLAAAHSLNRLKELGVRKVMGAKKAEIIIQFFVEAFFMNVFALLLAVGIVFIGQSVFNNAVDKTLSLEAIDLLSFGVPVLIFFLFGVICSGLYPLSVFFSMGTVSILKGKPKKGAGSSLSRKGLIVFQFVSGSLLIMITFAINRQLDFMTSKDMGMNTDRVLVLDGPAIKDGSWEQKIEKSEHMVNRLRELSNVQYAGVSNSIPGVPILQSQTLSRGNHGESKTGQFELVTGSEYLKILDVGLMAGRGFEIKTKERSNPQKKSPEEEIERVSEIILSESALKKLGFENPSSAIGEVIYRGRHEGSSPAMIVGVVEDYHHEALKNKIDPMVFYAGNSWDNHYLVKLKSNETAATIGEIEEIYESVFPGNPVNYYFLNEFFGRQYQSEEVNSRVFAGFSMIAILVACLGLFGLSSFIALQRTKEIGVRKVLGAGMKSVFFLLSKELMLLAALGFLLAAPLGYFGISRWLEGFAYHISISAFLFLVPLLMVIVLAFLAIGPRVMKTAFMNPVKSLRHE